MTELPAPVAREPIHTRQVTTRGYLRADNLWDIEGELIDTKAYASINPDGRRREAGESVHHMRVRLTLDDRMTVREAVAAMVETPFPECPSATPPVAALVGASCSAGWRKSVEAAMGDVRGCTHVRELLYAIATVALQTIMPYRNMQKRQQGVPVYGGDTPAAYMGQCLAWDFDGALMERRFPQFVGWRKPEKREPG